jgi:uncharacterized protein
LIDPAPPPGADLQTPEGDRSEIGNVPWSVGDAIAVLAVWLLAVIFLGSFAVFGLQRLFPAAPPQAFNLAVTQVLLIATVLTYVRVRHPGAVARLFGPGRPTTTAVFAGLGAGFIALVVFGFGLGNLLTLIANALETELPEVQEGFRELAAQESATPLLVFGAVVVGPFAEELFYRGMLFPALRRRLPLWPAMGLSGVLFGLSHLQTTLEGYLLVLIIIIPLGMFLAWVYERRGTLVVPVLAHAVFNLVQLIFMFRAAGQL